MDTYLFETRLDECYSIMADLMEAELGIFEGLWAADVKAISINAGIRIL